jgi:GNAT superfamily N-acetyltransferase
VLLTLDVADADEICLVVNDAAAVYRGVIPADCWKEPYMPLEEVHAEFGAGVVFWGYRRGGRLAGVMGLQQVHDVTLIRHAYTRTSEQGAGVGSALLEHLRRQTDRPLLVGTWQAATWAVRFYERRGFRPVSDEEKPRLLKRYWTVPERQIEESVVLRSRRDSVRGE